VRRPPGGFPPAQRKMQRLFRTELRNARAHGIVLTIAGAVVAPEEQQETTMERNERNAEIRELTDAEVVGVAGGLTDEVLFFIAALASPSPYNPQYPDYSGWNHMIGTCPK